MWDKRKGLAVIGSDKEEEGVAVSVKRNWVSRLSSEEERRKGDFNHCLM